MFMYACFHAKRLIRSIGRSLKVCFVGVLCKVSWVDDDNGDVSPSSRWWWRWLPLACTSCTVLFTFVNACYSPWRIHSIVVVLLGRRFVCPGQIHGDKFGRMKFNVENFFFASSQTHKKVAYALSARHGRQEFQVSWSSCGLVVFIQVSCFELSFTAIRMRKIRFSSQHRRKPH